MVYSWKYNLARRANIYFLFTTTVCLHSLMSIVTWIAKIAHARSPLAWFSLLPRQQVQGRS